MPTGCHPRHPPRAFPLGLRAPRCLCALLFSRHFPRARGGRGQRLYLGRGRNPLPSVGLILALLYLRVSLCPLVLVCVLLCLALAGLRIPPLAQPLSSFASLCLLCRFRL